MPLKAINDLSRSTRPIAGELAAAAARVLESGWFVLGSEVAAFENEFAAYCGVPQCVTVANGTDALELALRSLGVGPGAKVATVANAGMYSSTAIVAAGARPLYVDVDESSMLMSAASLESSDLRGCTALVLTHLFGQLADVERIGAIAASAGIPVIEDCAQAHGAALSGRKAGSFGAAACFSFYPTKNLGALGDGGAVVTGDPRLAAELRKLRQYGWSSKYTADLPGGRNSRLDEIQAAFLRAKLPHLDGWNQRRREVARRYRSRINHPRVRLPAETGDTYVAHLFVVRSPQRDSLATHLKAASIPFDIHYPIPDYRQHAMSGVGKQAPLPATELACSTVLTLPCFPELTFEEIDEISDAINAWSPGS
jgi:dTDP-4-amino-4,6-dideoxygalactose transaminase